MEIKAEVQYTKSQLVNHYVNTLSNNYLMVITRLDTHSLDYHILEPVGYYVDTQENIYSSVGSIYHKWDGSLHLSLGDEQGYMLVEAQNMAEMFKAITEVQNLASRLLSESCEESSRHNSIIEMSIEVGGLNGPKV